MTCRLRIVELTLRALNLSGLGLRKQAQNGALAALSSGVLKSTAEFAAVQLATLGRRRCDYRAMFMGFGESSRRVLNLRC
jgi:hypothetical protein